MTRPTPTWRVWGLLVGMALLVLARALPLEAQTAAAPADVPAGTDPLPVVEHTLGNGMRVLVLERQGSPTVAFVVHYKVGGVNERPGETGIAHLLEHMLFKGSTTVGTTDLDAELALFPAIDAVHDSIVAAVSNPRVLAPERNRLRNKLRRLENEARRYVEPNQFSRILATHGARGLNATTSAEATRYYVELPANRVELWMMLEADRMINPVFREFYRERDVVLQERRQRVEGEPDGVLTEAHLEAAFTVHPYRQPVVGYREDVASLGRREVEAYYRQYYGARNAVVTVVGDVDADQVIRWAEAYLGRVPPGREPPQVTAVEPDQEGERRANVAFDAEPRFRISWHVPDNSHADAAALYMMSTLLTGGRTSRLYDRLVIEDRSATSVSASVGPGGRYPTLLTVAAYPRTPHTVSEVEATIYEEIARLAEVPPAPAELERVRNQLEAARVRRLVSNLGLAFQLSEAEAESGDWRESYRTIDRIQRVTPQDVQRVAARYLRADNRTVSVLVRPDSTQRRWSRLPGRRARVTPRDSLPATGADDDPDPRFQASQDPRAPEIGLEPALRFRGPRLRFRPPQVRKRTIHGVPVIYAKDATLPMMNVMFRFSGGYGIYPRDHYGTLTALPALLRNGGSESISPDSVDTLMEYYAIQSSFGGGGDALVTSFNVIDRHFGLTMDLWRELLLAPGFDSVQVEVWRGQAVENVRRRFDSPVRMAYARFNHLMYGDHPIGWELSEEDLEPEDVTASELRRYHAEIICRDNLIMGVAGNLDWEEVEPHVERLLAGLPECATELPDAPQPTTRSSGGVFLIPNPSEQAVIVMGQPSTIRQGDSERYVASRIGNAILGASGFSSRLVQRVRTEAGMAYSAASVWTTRTKSDGLLGAVTQTSPESAVPAVKLIREILGEFSAEGPTTHEVRDAVDETVNSYVFGFQSVGQMVSRRMALEGQSLPADWPERYLERVQALDRRDVHRVFRATYDPTQMTVLIVGDPARLGAALDELGPIEILPKDRLPETVGPAVP